MITIQHEGRLTVIGVFGQLELADFRQIESEVGAQIQKTGGIDLLVDLRDMLGTTLGVALEDLKFSINHAHAVGKIALLSDSDAVAWTTLLSRLFVDAELAVFDSEDAAREWLQ
jgi:hypothetical protein